MYKIKTFNQISVKGLERFSREKYEVASDIGCPDAVLLRSHKLHNETLPIGRFVAEEQGIPKGLRFFLTPR